MSEPWQHLTVSVPDVPEKHQFASVYRAEHFVAQLRENKWDPGPLPDAVIFTYAGFDLLFAAQPDEYTMNPMLGTGPGRFFAVNATSGRVAVSCLGIGAPAVVAQLEILAALGVRRFLSLGTAGGLQAQQQPGDVVVLSGAIRDEGTSYHYVGPNIDATPDAELTAELASAIASAGMNATTGMTWTLDAPFRQTAEEIAHFRRRGVLAVEMEASALFAVARAGGIASGVGGRARRCVRRAHRSAAHGHRHRVREALRAPAHRRRRPRLRSISFAGLAQLARAADL